MLLRRFCKTPKNAIVASFSSARTVLGDAIAQSVAVAQTKGDVCAIAQALSRAKIVIGDAVSQSKAFANSPGGNSVAQAGVVTENAFDKAVAVAKAICVS